MTGRQIPPRASADRPSRDPDHTHRACLLPHPRATGTGDAAGSCPSQSATRPRSHRSAVTHERLAHTANGHTRSCTHTHTTSLAEWDWVQEDSQTRFDTHRELALVYSMSKNRIYKGQPRFKYQTVALGRSMLRFSGLASSPGIRPREGRDRRTGRPEGRHLLPGVCPRVSSPSHGAQGGAGAPMPLHCNRHRVQESLQPRTPS